MTLDQLISIQREAPLKGSYEIIKTSDNVNHLVVITHCRDCVVEGKHTREYAFHVACGRADIKATEVEAAPRESITCIQCIQWRPTR